MGGSARYARSTFYRLTLSSMLALAFCSMQPRNARADSLSLLAETGENNFSIVNCSSNATPTASCGTAPMIATVTGSLSTGSVGSMAEASGALINFTGQTNWSVVGEGTLDYVYTVTGTESGTLDTTLTVNGTSLVTGTPPCAPSCYASGDIAITSAESFGGSFTGLLPNGPFTFNIITPIVSGTADFNFTLITAAVCPPEILIEGNTCSASADYLDPVMITGASVYDANGNLVRNATIVSQSGYSPPSSSTPEPSSILLLGTGALGLARLLHQKQVAGDK